MSDWNTRHRLPAYGSVLDGCSGEGAVTRGLLNAGLRDVWGVDSNPALEAGYMRSGAKGFICADILDVLADEKFMSRIAAVSSSPPCQSGSNMCNCRPGLAATYPQLIGPVRDLLIPLGIPFVIENVSGNRARLINPETLCMWGHFGREGYRHRLVEAGGGLVLKPPAGLLTEVPAGSVLNKRLTPDPECGQLHPVKAAKAGHWKEGLFVSVSGHERKEPVRRVMEIDWMSNRDAVAEAVPPYMAEWWGTQLREHLEASDVAA